MSRLSEEETLSEEPKLHNTVDFKDRNLQVKLAAAQQYISNKSVATLKLQRIIRLKCTETTESLDANFALVAPSLWSSWLMVVA